MYVLGAAVRNERQADGRRRTGRLQKVCYNATGPALKRLSPHRPAANERESEQSSSFMVATLTVFGPREMLHCRRYQHMLDKTVVHIVPRWLSLVALLALYALRVYLINGWYIVSYGLGIYLLNMFIGFISPQVGTRGS